jgi:hypothetical protein
MTVEEIKKFSHRQWHCGCNVIDANVNMVLTEPIAQIPTQQLSPVQLSHVHSMNEPTDNVLNNDIRANTDTNSYSSSQQVVYDESVKTLRKHMKDLKIVQLNARSLKKKKSNFIKMVKDMGENTILGINETWLDTSDTDNNWIIDKELFDIFRQDRNKENTGKKRGGGSMILCPKHLAPKRRLDLELTLSHIESIWIDVTTNGKKILINLIYNPPENNHSKFEEFLSNNIDQVVAENKPIIITGDFNQNILCPLTAQKITNILTPYGMSLCNTTNATRQQGSTETLIDITASDIEGYKTIISDAPLNTDHHMTTVIFPIKANLKRQKARIVTTLDTSNYDKNAYLNELNNRPFSPIYRTSCPQIAYNYFENIVGSTLHAHAPVTRKFVKPKGRSDFIKSNARLRSLATQKKLTYDAYSICKNDTTYNAYRSARNFYNNALKDTYKKTKTMQFNKLNTDKKRWNFINDMRQTGSSMMQINELRNSLGDIITENTKKAELLNYKFITLGDYNENQIEYPVKPYLYNKPKFSFKLITDNEVLSYINKLDNRKPLGPSTIPAWAIKDAAKILTPHICYLINLSIINRVFPSQLKLADVTPVYKKGDKADPSNYRPISVTCAMSKIYERAFCSQITKFLDDNQILSSSQFGFQKSKSATDAVSFFTETIRKELDTGNCVSAAFLDLSKAFDSLNHEILQLKLEEIGFTIPAAQLIHSYLQNRMQRVNVNGTKSTWYATYQGVPQGTILGPILFLIYVYDLHHFVGSNNICQYADDTAVFVSGKSTKQNSQELEVICDKLLEYFKMHRLKVNISKTEYIIFSKKGAKVINETLNIGDQALQPTAYAKYLGIYLDAQLTFDKQINIILRKMAAGIKTIYSLRNYIPLTSRLLLLRSIVLSHLTYPAPILTSLSQKHLDSLNSQITWGLKACCNTNRTTSSLSLMKAHKILPAKLQINLHIATYFFKIANKYTKAFNFMDFPTQYRVSSRGVMALDVNRIKSNYLKYCLTKRGCDICNSITNCPTTGNLLQFKAIILKHMLDSLESSVCIKILNKA